jgi:hypothetical protein
LEVLSTIAEDVIADSKGKKFGYYIFTPISSLIKPNMQ